MNRQKWILVVVVFSLIGGTAAFLARRQQVNRLGLPGLKLVDRPSLGEKGKSIGTNSVYLPTEVPNYQAEPLEITDIEVDFLPKDTTFGRMLYISTNKLQFQVQTSVVLMGTDRASIHKPQFCLVGKGWQIDKTELLSIPVTRPVPYDLPVMRLTATIEVKDTAGTLRRLRGVYVYWFVCENRLTAQHGERMWWLAQDLITTGVLPRWAYVSYLAVCRPGAEDEVYARMSQLIAATVPEFQTYPAAPAAPNASPTAMLR